MGMPISLHIKAIDVDRERSRPLPRMCSPPSARSTTRSARGAPIANCASSRSATSPPAIATRGRPRSSNSLGRREFTDGLFTAWHTPGGGGVTGVGVRRDPTGIVKGMGGRRRPRCPGRSGISFCLSAGGDLVVGTGPGVQGSAPAWLIGIESPFAPGPAGSVEITAGAVATSGSAARGAHVIDPRTGLGVERPGSATVVGPDLVWADVWATAAYVDPPRPGGSWRSERRVSPRGALSDLTPVEEGADVVGGDLTTNAPPSSTTR